MRAGPQGAVVVTGAAGDMGGAIARSWAADGWRVYGCDVRPVELEGLVPVTLDVTDRAAVFAVAERAAAEAGGLAVWVNAAGIVVVTPVRQAAEEEWRRILDVNLTGTWHGCAAALEVMAAGGRGGSIINIGSLSGMVGGTGLHPAYGASKAAVHALTKTYALEGAKAEVRCNAVAPSVLEGSMGSQFSEQQRERLIKTNPLRRLGTMDDVVGVVRFLASPASAYITGSVIPVNGGSYMP